MAELTTLEEKLAEVLGLAQAAQDATEKIEGMVEDEEIVTTLRQMRDEAEETERRCTDVADTRDGKKTAILEKAQETKAEATEMMATYLGGDADGLDGFEFLTMAEAGEVGHWAVLGKLNESAQDAEVSELVEWALPIQERHFADVKDGSLKLAAEKDPYEESW
jgi:methyl-accepting chemotaxis protein